MIERLSGIEAFVAAVEAGNFTQAAQRLGLTRSAVAKSVSKLEQRVGAQLFHRTTRTQALTEQGHAYYEHCRRALAEIDAGDAAMEAGRRTASGRLAVTMPALIGQARIAPLLVDLAARHPQLAFDIAFNDRRVDLVEEGFDLAIRSGPLDDSASLAARPLGRQWMGVYAAPAYLAAHGRPSSLDRMASRRAAHRFIGYVRNGHPQPWRFHDRSGALTEFDTPGGFGCNHLDVARQAAVAGLGLARLPVWFATDAVEAGTLVRVFREPHPYGYELSAVWPAARALPFKLRLLIDVLAEQLPPLLARR